jgi:hypothetical protein
MNTSKTMKKLSAIKLVKVGSLVITLAKGYKVKNKKKLANLSQCTKTQTRREN